MGGWAITKKEFGQGFQIEKKKPPRPKVPKKNIRAKAKKIRTQLWTRKKIRTKVELPTHPIHCHDPVFTNSLVERKE